MENPRPYKIKKKARHFFQDLDLGEKGLQGRKIASLIRPKKKHSTVTTSSQTMGT